MRKSITFFFAFILVTAILITPGCSTLPQEQIKANLVSPEVPPTGFQRADGSLSLSFPQDYGPHPEYQTEWWYYTGNLDDVEGCHFGYQLTFFRRALLPENDRVNRYSKWSSDQVYMAHFAISDIAADQHHAFERFSRGAPDLAGATAEPFGVWLEDWRVEQTAPGAYQLIAQQDDIEIDLFLTDIKGPVLHGDQGYSQKGPEKGNASYYFSQTRLDTNGTVKIKGVRYQVNGLSWMDHEFSTSALSEGQVGWDWFSIQLDNDMELMVFQIRREDGSIDPYSSGTLVNPDNFPETLTNVAFQIQVLDTWTSPTSGAEYPIRWTITVPEKDLILDIQPYMIDQELDVSFTYWEGAVQVEGRMQGEQVRGNGYIELTGYAESMKGEF